MKVMVNTYNQVDDVRNIFNEMSEEYDNLKDLWYRYTFGFIDKVLDEEFSLVQKNISNPTALDIGCGTGIQSLRLAQMGYRVIGVDVADELLKIAENKLSKAGYHNFEFYNSNAEALPFDDNFADCVNCCGPTLSFIPDWSKSIAEMSRCIKPGGKMLLEVEGKWNMDLIWEVINALGFNFLGYDESLNESLKHFKQPWGKGHSIDYSFKLESGNTVTMPLKLFTAKEIKEELLKAHLVVDKRWGLHALTNLIPSTVLHEADPSKITSLIFGLLSSYEKCINHLWPLNSLGCSLLIKSIKT